MKIIEIKVISLYEEKRVALIFSYDEDSISSKQNKFKV